jgi:hypothetical protein
MRGRVLVDINVGTFQGFGPRRQSPLETLEKDLASFARQHGHALDSDDPRAVMEAEANLATLVNGEWINRLRLDLGVHAHSSRNDVDTPGPPWRLSELTAALGSGFDRRDWGEVLQVHHRAMRVVAREEDDGGDDDSNSPHLRWSCGALRAPKLDARNRAAALSVERHLEYARWVEMDPRKDGPADWSKVAFALALSLEEALHSCLFEAGRQAWHEGTRPENRFYSPILESIFEKGGKPTLVHYEAIAYLLRRQDTSQAPLPDLGPVATRLVLMPHFRAALEHYRGVRNQLAHAGGEPWDKDAYRTHCELLFGYPSASEWLDGNFAVDSTGTLGEGGRNLLSSVLVNRYLHEAVERSPGVGLTLVLAGFLQRSDLPTAWSEWLLPSAENRGWHDSGGSRVLGLVHHALNGELLSPFEFDTTWLERLCECVSIDEALKTVRCQAVEPSAFPATWKRRVAEGSNWHEYQELQSCGLLCPDESDAGLRRRKLGQLRLKEARMAVEAGAHPSEFDDAWREKMAGLIESLNLGDLDWLLENGLLAGAKVSKPPLASWRSKNALRKAASLVRAGLADPSDFRPSWGPLLSAAAAQAKQE